MGLSAFNLYRRLAAEKARKEQEALEEATKGPDFDIMTARQMIEFSEKHGLEVEFVGSRADKLVQIKEAWAKKGT